MAENITNAQSNIDNGLPVIFPYPREVTEREIPPDKTYSVGGETAADLTDARLLFDVSDLFPQRNLLCTFPWRTGTAKQVYTALGSNNYGKLLGGANKIQLHQGKYDSAAVCKNAYDVPWIQKYYTEMVYVPRESYRDYVTTPVPMSLAGRITEEMIAYYDIFNRVVPGFMLPLSDYRILAVPNDEDRKRSGGAEVYDRDGRAVYVDKDHVIKGRARSCWIMAEQPLLTEGTFSDALHMPAENEPAQLWNQLENLLKRSLNYVSQVLNFDFSKTHFIPQQMLPFYYDPNPKNLVVLSDYQSYDLRGCDVWPCSILDPVRRRPTSLNTPEGDEYIYFPRKINEVTIRYFTKFGVAANVIRGLMRALEGANQDMFTVMQIWNERINPIIMGHDGFTQIVKEYFCPPLCSRQQLAQIILVLALTPLYNIDDINGIRSINRLPALHA